MGCVETCLDEVLALWLSDERLKLGGRKSIHQSGFRYDEQQYLGSSQSRKFISLIKWRTGASAHIQGTQIPSTFERTFFIIPALRFEKVMCLLDLS